MTDRGAVRTASLCMVAGLALGGCGTAADAEVDAAGAPAVVEEAPDGGPAHLRLTEEAMGRLGIETASVEGAAGALTVPYSAVVYDADGGSWAFVELEPGVYQRAAIAIAAIEGDVVRLSDGPGPGTQVVTVAAAELVGVEAGISGGE
jgi:hypothetical protein